MKNKKKFVSLIAAILAIGLNACDDSSGNLGKTECNPADGECTSSVCKCGDGSDCPSGDSSLCPPAGSCQCEDGSDCPGGEASNCATSGTCKCQDGSDCPSGKISECPAGPTTCKCQDGSDCPGGEASNCTTTGTCKCQDGSDCPSGDSSKCPFIGSCQCEDGSECPDGEAVNCHTTQVTCKCWDRSDCPDGKVSECPDAQAEIVLGKDGLTVDEGLDVVNQLMLATMPSADVTIAITTEGSCSVSPNSIKKTPDDYNITDEFTVSATYDESLEDKTCKVKTKASSADTNYNGKEAEVTYTIKNTDEPALILSLDSTVIREPIDYSEEPESVTACIKLATQPKKDVVVNVSGTTSAFRRFSFAGNGDETSTGTITISKLKYNADDNCIKIYAYRDYKVNDDSEPAKMMFIADETDYDSEYNLKKAFGAIYIKNIDSYDYSLEDSDKNVLSVENSLIEGEEILFKPVLMTSSGKSVRIKAESSNPDVLTIYQYGAVSKKYVDVPKGNITSIDSFTVKAKNDNTVAEIPPVKITFTVESEDENFSKIEAKEYTFNISDADTPSILMSCAPSELRNIKDDNCAYASEEEAEGGYITCSVRLGTKPSQNVDVAVNAMSTDGYDKSRQVLTFKPSNYSSPQKAVFRFRRADRDKVTRVYGKSGDISADVVDKTKYNAKMVIVSDRFERFFDCEYQFFEYTGDYQKAYLRKGTYDLYAWGASGSPADAKNMKLKDHEFVCYNRGGTGGFVRGSLTITDPQNIFVYVGESGKSSGTSYNGGGAGSEHSDAEKRGLSGGGATDFCIGNDNNCNRMMQHRRFRILVAGGGGGGLVPDKCWSENMLYARGGDVVGINKKGESDTEYSIMNTSFGYHWDISSSGRYYAPPGRNTANYCIRDNTYNQNQDLIYEKHEELFGVGQDAVKDNAQIDSAYSCAHIGDPFNTNEFWRHGGGGGGWYGGMSANWVCLKSVGGGAGSSYAFTAQSDNYSEYRKEYVLTNVDGGVIYPYGNPYFPRLSIDENHLITGLETLDNKISKVNCLETPCYGNVGHGYALIRAQKK